jgi:DNA-directed RNA polymerase specialized sigma24 family protein
MMLAPPTVFRNAIQEQVFRQAAEETSRALSLSVPAVKSRLHRGRLALRHSLARFAEPRKA